MRKELLGAISALALMTGAAFAQDTSTSSDTSTSQPAPAMQNQQGSGTDMQAQGGGASETEADVTIIEPGEGEEAGTDMQAQGGGTGETEADVTIIEPGEGEEAEADMPAPGEAAETTVVEPGEGEETMAADTASAEELMGKSVVGSDGEELGEVSDVILDPQTGEAQQIVIASGGFLGLGERTVAVDYQDLQIEPGAENIQATSLTQQMVEEMPEFEYTDEMTSLGRQGEAADETVGAVEEGDTVVVTEPETETAQ